MFMSDGRDLNNDCYCLEYKEGSNTATLTKPLLPAPLRFDKAEYEYREPNRHYQVGHDMVRNAFQHLPEDKRVQKFTLQFEAGVKLTEIPYLPTTVGAPTINGDTGQRQAHPCMMVYQRNSGVTTAAGGQINDIHYRVIWRLADQSKAHQLEAQANTAGARAALAAYQGL
jgi:hypothetical protein